MVDTQPRHPARWLYGEGIGVQVWEISMGDSTQVAVVIGEGGPLVLLSAMIAGSSREWPALAWALRKIASQPRPGVHLRLA